jgi:uncharacterized DUF497 family protein
MRIQWDDGKSEKLRRERGLSFEEAAEALRGLFCLVPKNEDPEQFLGIGFAKGQLISVVFEYREGLEGEFIWLVTYWKATKQEAREYEKFRKA